MSTFGERLRKARKARKLTQAQLAEKIGMSQGNISDIENGHVPTSTYTPMLAEALGVPAIWLATAKGSSGTVEADGEEPRPPAYDAGVTDVTLLQLPSNSPARESAAEYVVPRVTYEEVKRAVTGVLQLLDIRYEDLVVDDVAARYRVEAALHIPSAGTSLPSEQMVTGAEVTDDPNGIVKTGSSEADDAKKKPA